MRIVFLDVTGSLGGAERLLLTLLGELRRLRPAWEITLVTGSDGPLCTAATKLGCQAETLTLPASIKSLGDWGASSRLALISHLVAAVPGLLRYRLQLRRRLRALAPDIVQTVGFKMHLLGALACPRRSRLIWHIHDFVSNRRVMRTVLQRFSAKPQAVVAISPEVAADVRNFAPAVRTVLNSIDLTRFAPIAKRPFDCVRIGMAATFARWKGHDVFLKALTLLPSDRAWRGYIAGGDIYERSASQWSLPELRALAGERVEFTGFLEDPAPFVQTLDIAVHASTEPEPFGLSIAEAMACGCAVITTSASLVTDGVNALVVPPGDADALANAMLRLLSDPDLRQRLGEAAHRTATERFQPERMAGEFIAIYQSLA